MKGTLLLDPLYIIHNNGENYKKMQKIIKVLKTQYRSISIYQAQTLALEHRMDHPERTFIEGKAEKLVAEQHLEVMYTELWKRYELC